jgi:hypothetical protein
MELVMTESIICTLKNQLLAAVGPTGLVAASADQAAYTTDWLGK